MSSAPVVVVSVVDSAVHLSWTSSTMMKSSVKSMYLGSLGVGCVSMEKRVVLPSLLPIQCLLCEVDI